MRFFSTTRALALALLAISCSPCLPGQTPPAKEASETKGIPPRATPADYQFQTQVGTVTLAAEFTGHSLPTFEGPLTTEDFVAVEAALYGPAGTPLTISAQHFSLRINGKTPLPSKQFGLVTSSLRDPDWIPPDQPAASKSKSSIGGGGQGQGEPSGPPPPVKIPIPLQRAMAQRVQKASLPEGDRVLPQAGLLFFQFRGKDQNMQTIELLYEGPAGKATLKLRP